MSLTWRCFFFSLIHFSAAFAFAEHADQPKAGKPIPSITNMNELAKNLKLSVFKNRKFDRRIKIAILDNGFNGYQGDGFSDYKDGVCPNERCYHAGKESAADEIVDKSLHGLFMANLLTQIIEKSGLKADYELHLFFSYGYTKLADAVETVVNDRFDIVLYSQVWEFGGNGDGKGFINALVDKAVHSGIIWINAAGNFGHLMRLAPIVYDDDWVPFKNAKGKSSNGVMILCNPPAGQQCQLRLVLAWNDFKDDPDTGTDKDLDLFLYDNNKKQIASSERRQKLTEDDSDKQASKFPRELIETKIVPGAYTARVKVISKNFSSQDQLRLTASGIGVEMVDATAGETLLPPAENLGVITIGASDDIQSSESEKLKKPEIYLTSAVHLEDGTLVFSTSTAAAMATAIAVLELGTGTESTRTAVLDGLKTISKPPGKITAEMAAAPVRIRVAGKPTQEQKPVRPRAQDCASPAKLPVMNPAAQWVLDQGHAIIVSIDSFPIILVSYDFAAYAELPNEFPKQRVFASPEGLVIFEEQSVPADLPLDYYEIVSARIPLCRTH